MNEKNKQCIQKDDAHTGGIRHGIWSASCHVGCLLCWLFMWGAGCTGEMKFYGLEEFQLKISQYNRMIYEAIALYIYRMCTLTNCKGGNRFEKIRGIKKFGRAK